MKKVNYGNTVLNFSLPTCFRCMEIGIKEEKPLESYEEAFFHTIENPIGENSFSEWITHFKKVLIIVPDITRYAAVDKLLPLLYRRYLENKEVSVLFALGNHRKHNESEKMSILTEPIYKKIPSFDHDCFSESTLTFLGRTKSGIPVYLNSMFLQADCVIVFGSINFHYLAGFGGGRKAIIPGIAGYETIIGVHRKVFKEKGKHDLAKSGILHGNPMHEEIMSGINLIEKPIFLINTVTEDDRIVAIFAGNLEKAHSFGCNWYVNRYGVPVKKKADVVIVSAGGYPNDINFIQTHKAIEHVVQGIKKGGWMIVIGACKDGIGHDNFIEFFEYGTSEEMEEVVRKSDKVYSQTAYATKLKAEYCRIILVSELSESLVFKMGLIPKRNIDEAIASVDDGMEKDCYLVYDGSKTLLIFHGGQDGM
ncbi:MAG: nickel-dependent lactate racemase [Deltaproteobacteria bacterium]|nr:nickel-dependent lactate racemase [Deltaproteobacteria bacterium]